MIRFFALVLAAGPLLPQSRLDIDLSGEWRQSSIDDPAAAAPDFADSGWRPFPLPMTATDLPGSGWLRRTVDLPDWADRTQLALTLGPLHTIYSVFVNGHLVATVGSMENLGKTQLRRIRTFPIPAEAAEGSRRLTIAIRYPATVTATPAIWRVDQEAPYLLTYMANAPVRAGSDSLALLRARSTPALVTAAVYLVFCVPLLVAWAGARQRSELLWLAAVLFATSIFNAQAVLSISSASTPFNSAGTVWLQTLTRTAVWAASISFVIAALRFRPAAWLHALIWSSWIAVQFASWTKAWFSVYMGTKAWFSVYMGFGIVTGVVALALIAAASRNVASERSRFSQRLLLVLLTLRAIEMIQFAVTALMLGPTGRNAQQYLAFGGYQITWSDLLALVLGTSFLILLLREFVMERRNQQRLKGEMEAGRSAQLFLLGGGAPVHIGDFAIDAVHEPALEVGGDFHWTHAAAEGSVIVAVGDVSGKGLKAAMLVSVAIGILRNEKSVSPAAILGALNEGLSGHTGGGFVTCCCARFDPDGTAAIANAGHPAPYCDGREAKVEAGLPLGIAAGIAYTECVTRGERFTFVSDGVVEAAGTRGELFGFDRTCAISSKAAREIAEAAKAWGQNDDITVVTVWRGA